MTFLSIWQHSVGCSWPALMTSHHQQLPGMLAGSGSGACGAADRCLIGVGFDSLDRMYLHVSRDWLMLSSC
jgi:hypothetical protein